MYPVRQVWQRVQVSNSVSVILFALVLLLLGSDAIVLFRLFCIITLQCLSVKPPSEATIYLGVASHRDKHAVRFWKQSLGLHLSFLAFHRHLMY